MVFNYIGEVGSVREPQKQYVTELLSKRGFKDCDVFIEPVGQAGDNYVANVKRIVVKQNEETLKMIAKLAPDNPMMRQMGNIRGLFENEHVIYTEVFPKYRELQLTAGVPEKELFRHAACYGTSLEHNNEVILLEDLTESKFCIVDRFKPLTNEYVKLVLKNFAIFHSLSYVLKDQEPELFEVLKSKLVNTHTVNTPELLEMWKQVGTRLEENVTVQLDDKRYQSIFRGSISNLIELAAEQEEYDAKSKYSVIQQGDGWTNNILFKLDEEQPLQCVLIDYQMTKASNPMYDIMYMIFNSTGTEQRIQYYTEFIDYYYNELDKSLNTFGLKASEIYPREQLNDDMKRNAKLILAISIIVTNLIVKDVTEASKIQEVMKTTTELNEENLAVMMEQTTESQALFKSKLEGLAKSFVELGLLQTD